MSENEATGPVTAIDADGWIVNAETGEVIGREGIGSGWTIDSVEAADWALKLQSEIQADILAIDARIQAVTANLQALRRAKVRRLSYWDFRFASQLVTFARTQLRGRSKTAQFTWGRVSYRTMRGTTSVIDDAAALDYVRTWAPDQIRRTEPRETVNVAAIAEAHRRAVAATGEDDPLPFIVTSHPHEEATIQTGIPTPGEES